MEAFQKADLSLFGRKDYSLNHLAPTDNFPGFNHHTHEQKTVSETPVSSGYDVALEDEYPEDEDFLPLNQRSHMQGGSVDYKKELAVQMNNQLDYRGELAVQMNNQLGVPKRQNELLTADPSKTFVCTLCSRRFRRQEHLKRHYRSLHTQDKPFECNECGKKFSRSDMLAQHARTHGSGAIVRGVLENGELQPLEPFSCEQCGEAFSTESESVRHMMRHKKRFTCDILNCPVGHAEFATKNDVEHHKRLTHHIGVTGVYKCCVPGCKDPNKLWDRKDNFQAHVKRMHPGMKPDDVIKRSFQVSDAPKVNENSNRFVNNTLWESLTRDLSPVSTSEEDEQDEEGSWSRPPFCNNKFWISHTISEDRSGNSETVSQQRLAALGARCELAFQHLSIDTSPAVPFRQRDTRLQDSTLHETDSKQEFASPALVHLGLPQNKPLEERAPSFSLAQMQLNQQASLMRQRMMIAPHGSFIQAQPSRPGMPTQHQLQPSVHPGMSTQHRMEQNIHPGMPMQHQQQPDKAAHYALQQQQKLKDQLIQQQPNKAAQYALQRYQMKAAQHTTPEQLEALDRMQQEHDRQAFILSQRLAPPPQNILPLGLTEQEMSLLNWHP